MKGLLPALTADDTYSLLVDEIAAAASFGLTSVQDATDGGLTENEPAAVVGALAEGELRVCYRAAVPFEKDVTAGQLAQYLSMFESTRGGLFTYGFAKGMLDGTVDAKTAAVPGAWRDRVHPGDFRDAGCQHTAELRPIARTGARSTLECVQALRRCGSVAGIRQRLSRLSDGPAPRDLLSRDAAELLETRVLLTLMGGRETFRRDLPGPGAGSPTPRH